jgi:hypothetical protein
MRVTSPGTECPHPPKKHKEVTMNMKLVFWDFVANFSLTIVVAAIVTFLWSLIAHGSGIIDWEISFVLAFVMAAVQASRKWQELKGK